MLQFHTWMCKFTLQGSLLFFSLVEKQNVAHHSMRNLSVILINVQPHLRKLKYAEVMMHYLKDSIIFYKFLS